MYKIKELIEAETELERTQDSLASLYEKRSKLAAQLNGIDTRINKSLIGPGEKIKAAQALQSKTLSGWVNSHHNSYSRYRLHPDRDSSKCWDGVAWLRLVWWGPGYHKLDTPNWCMDVSNIDNKRRLQHFYPRAPIEEVLSLADRDIVAIGWALTEVMPNLKN